MHRYHGRTTRGIGAAFAGATVLVAMICFGDTIHADDPARDASETWDATPGDDMLAAYFRSEIERLVEQCPSNVDSLDAWESRRAELRDELREMYGLKPLPERTPLEPVVTGVLENEDVRVEKIHFQSAPGLYVTANLYLPRDLEEPAPTVLYLCGHAQRTDEDGRPLGSKAAYQHHPAWFARNGYVSLIIDTLQLGEIEGLHHGPRRDRLWWWYDRGYHPGGVEAWNGIRALDYLETRPEVDMDRIGATGRSGGGKHSMLLAALDDRVDVVAAVAGASVMADHVLEHYLRRHCDCMFPQNLHRWDFPAIAGLIAPRPLLILNSDRDQIYPLEGVVELHKRTREIYRLYEEETALGLVITPGLHEDTQELRVPAFTWFNRHLKDSDELIEEPARALFDDEDLAVFDELPSDERNTTVDEWFVPAAEPGDPPRTETAWREQASEYRTALGERVFANWPDERTPPDAERTLALENDDVTLEAWDVTVQGPVRLTVFALRHADDRADANAGQAAAPRDVRLHVVDESAWRAWADGAGAFFGEAWPYAQESADVDQAADAFERMLDGIDDAGTLKVVVPPRGIGPTAWTADGRPSHMRDRVRFRNDVVHPRRFSLLGQTVDGMRALDVKRVAASVRDWTDAPDAAVGASASGKMAGVALYAAVMGNAIDTLHLHALPASHTDGPHLLHVMRFMDLPQALALAIEETDIRLTGTVADEARMWGRDVAGLVGRSDQLSIDSDGEAP